MKNLYSTLENKMVGYKDLLKISVADNQEKLVLVNKEITGGKIYVRKKVSQKLIKAQSMVKNQNKKYSLFVACGYRSLKIQKERFDTALKRVSKANKDRPLMELYEMAHRMIAVPEVAGHPTGGAVDITIIDKRMDQQIEFGSEMCNYTNKKHYVFTTNISRQAKKNRLLLRNLMMEAGFAPFDGEWWHFSYGDREWAFYYRRPFAIYSQIPTLPSFS